ncbi:hypothetical protein [Desulfurobacterium sp.]|uniref:hypothetical protein n=1 Tax=Desulfurobacterium sp. TaxID=2004706 RepID=UPI00260E4943|nr:hypothetical protein [Desulfurobacterium sp.]
MREIVEALRSGKYKIEVYNSVNVFPEKNVVITCYRKEGGKHKVCNLYKREKNYIIVIPMKELGNYLEQMGDCGVQDKDS